MTIIGDPLSLNLYTYCENDPIENTDPSGHYVMALVEVALEAVIFTLAAIVVVKMISDPGFQKAAQDAGQQLYGSLGNLIHPANAGDGISEHTKGKNGKNTLKKDQVQSCYGRGSSGKPNNL